MSSIYNSLTKIQNIIANVYYELERKNQMRHKDATVTRSQLVAEGKARSGLMCHSVEKESY